MLSIFDSAGVPLPGGVDALLVLLGAANPRLAWLNALAAVTGSTAGCLLFYWAARKGGQAYFEARAGSARAARLRVWFQRYGLLTVFIPALVPIPLPLKPFIVGAGALGVGPLRFVLTIVAARIPRYFGLAWLGARLGDGSMTFLRTHAWHLAGTAGALFLLLYLAMRRLDRSANPA